MRLLLWVLLCIGFVPLRGQGNTLPDAPVPSPRPSVQRDLPWERLQALAPGESLQIYQQSSGLASDCLLESVSDVALVCAFTRNYGSGRRVVYPKSTLDRVWVTREVRGPSPKKALIGLAVGAGLGGLFEGRVAGTARGVFTGMFFGAGVGGLVVLGSDPLGLELHTRRALIYRRPKL